MDEKKCEMTAASAIEIIKLFEQNGYEIVVDGGWGVDALLGSQSRPHEDLDIAVNHSDVPGIRAMLARQGYTEVPRNDSWECNFVMGDELGHLIDLHSCTFNEAHENIFGVAYVYESLQGHGSINGYAVRCIPPDWMVKFHTGYKLDENDYRDTRLLCRHFGITLPREYDEFVLREVRRQIRE